MFVFWISRIVRPLDAGFSTEEELGLQSFTHFVLIADALYKHLFGTDSLLFECLDNVLSSFKGRVGRIQGRNPHPVLSDIRNEIGQGGIAGDLARSQSLDVVGIEKIGRHLRPAELSSVVSDVEYLRRNVVEKTQEAADPFGNVGLSCGR